jgi:allantoin racemase
MKLLLINANLSAFVTAACAREAQASASPQTEIVAVTGEFGARIIGTRAENAIAQHGMLDLAAKHHAGCDAIVIAVSYDTALAALRELMPIPVVGMTEAALLTACMVGGRFGIVTLGPRGVPLYREVVEAYGLERRLAGIETIDAPASAYAAPETLVPAVLACCRTLVERDRAECIVLAGAALAGMQRSLQASVPVPLLDGIACAVRQAELLVRLALPKPTAGSLARVNDRDSAGLSPDLSTLLRG